MVKVLQVLLACSPFKEMTKLHMFLLLSFACRRTLQSIQEITKLHMFLLLSFSCRRTLQAIQEMTKLHFVFVAFLLLAEE